MNSCLVFMKRGDVEIDQMETQCCLFPVDPVDTSDQSEPPDGTSWQIKTLQLSMV